MTSDVLILLVAIAAGLLLLRFTLWRAILCVAPGALRIEADEPPGKERVPASLRARVAALEGFGFTSLGSHFERPPLGRARTSFDYGSAADGVFATVYEDRDGHPRVYFLSRFVSRAGDGFVITADHRRPAKSAPGQYQSGGLEEFPLDRVLKAHLRLLEKLEVDRTMTQEARLDAARSWLSTWGSAEVRMQHLPGLVLALGAVLLVGAVVHLWIG